MDLLLLTVITFIFELIATYATVKWFWVQAVAISITLTMTCIAMMRWSAYAVIPALAGGVAYCFASDATPQQYVIYILGNMFLMTGLLLIKFLGKERIRESRMVLSGFVIIAYIGMALGRWLVSLLFGGNASTISLYFTAEIISLVFAVVVVNLMKKTDGMIEDQKAYLLRLEKEKNESPIQEDQGVIL